MYKVAESYDDIFESLRDAKPESTKYELFDEFRYERLMLEHSLYSEPDYTLTVEYKIDMMIVECKEWYEKSNNYINGLDCTDEKKCILWLKCSEDYSDKLSTIGGMIFE